MTGCRIGKVRFKNGTELRVFPAERSNVSRVDLGWGEVVFRAYDADKLVARDLTYMCDAAKLIVLEDVE